jgi:hypothetical protein
MYDFLCCEADGYTTREAPPAWIKHAHGKEAVE